VRNAVLGRDGKGAALLADKRLVLIDLASAKTADIGTADIGEVWTMAFLKSETPLLVFHGERGLFLLRAGDAGIRFRDVILLGPQHSEFDKLMSVVLAERHLKDCHLSGGRRVVVDPKDERNALIVATEGGKPIVELRCANEPITRLAVSPDGGRIAAGDARGWIAVWTRRAGSDSVLGVLCVWEAWVGGALLIAAVLSLIHDCKHIRARGNRS
jgi:hypothetical protein